MLVRTRQLVSNIRSISKVLLRGLKGIAAHTKKDYIRPVHDETLITFPLCCSMTYSVVYG